MKHEFVATTTRGLEKVSMEEVEELVGRKAEIFRSGSIRFKGTLKDCITLNYVSRSLHRIILLLVKGTFQKLDEIYKMVRSFSFTDIIQQEQSLAVRAQRHGTHDFTSLDVASKVGQAVIDSYLDEKKIRLKVNLNEPDVILRAYVVDDFFFLGVDTTGDESLHRRGYRVYQHPAPLKPTIAYSLVRLSRWKSEESFIDPMCGSGTIPIEAVRYAWKVPSGFSRKSGYAFQKLKFFDQQEFQRIKDEFDSNIQKFKVDVHGCDLFRKHVEGAKLNAKEAGVDVNFFVGDATKVNLDYDVIVTNPPYGLRIASKKVLDKLYRGFAENLLKSSWKKLVVMTSESRLFLKYMGKDVNVVSLDIMYGNLPTKIFIAKN